MTLKQFISLLPRLIKYNLKIIFAGKFIWFLLAAFLFFAYFLFRLPGAGRRSMKGWSIIS